MSKSERKFLGIVYYVNDEPGNSSEREGWQPPPPLAWFVVVSWVATIGLVGAGLFSKPYMRLVAAGKPVEGLIDDAVVFLLIGGFCSWPWLLAFIKAHDPKQRGRAVAFAFSALAIAVYVFNFVSTAPEEGVGYGVILGVFLTWIAYPMSRIFASE